MPKLSDRMHFVRAGLLVVAAAANFCMGEVKKFQQDQFAIGFWVDPPADEKMDQRYREIAEANFTLVIGGFGAKENEDILRQIDLCRKYGLKLLAGTKSELDMFLGAPECWGAVLFDEPGVKNFPGLRREVSSLRTAFPGKLAYINLFPNYAGSRVLGTDYDDYVSRFVNEVDPDVLSMDHYPMMMPNRDGRKGYCDNLEVMRKYSLEKEIPFWNFFNTMPFGPHIDPTEAQIRWQIYTSLAYGAKGVLYFCYYTPLSHEFPKGGAIITRDDRKTRHYYEAQRINHALKNLGPTFMKLTSTAVLRVGPDEDSAVVLKGVPLLQLTTGDYLVGVFQHEDDSKAVLLNNYDSNYSAWPTVSFDAPLDSVFEIDQLTGTKIAILDDSPAMDGLQISLDAGAGRLFIIESND